MLVCSPRSGESISTKYQVLHVRAGWTVRHLRGVFASISTRKQVNTLVLKPSSVLLCLAVAFTSSDYDEKVVHKQVVQHQDATEKWN